MSSSGHSAGSFTGHCWWCHLASSVPNGNLKNYSNVSESCTYIYHMRVSWRKGCLQRVLIEVQLTSSVSPANQQSHSMRRKTRIVSSFPHTGQKWRQNILVPTWPHSLRIHFKNDEERMKQLDVSSWNGPCLLHVLCSCKEPLTTTGVQIWN